MRLDAGCALRLDFRLPTLRNQVGSKVGSLYGHETAGVNLLLPTFRPK